MIKSRSGSTANLPALGSPWESQAVLKGREFHLRVGLGQRDAGPQPSGDLEVYVHVIGDRGKLEGQPDVGLGIGEEVFPQNADDGVGLIAQRERLADDRQGPRRTCAATGRSSAPRLCRRWARPPAG